MDIKPLFLPTSESIKINGSLITFDHDGYNRTELPKFIDAKTDAQAISTFLDEYKDSPNTIASYAKEIERLILWCIHIGKVGISDITREHIIKYQDFLSDPQPQKAWCGSKLSRVKKDGSINPDWRPFYKSLSDASIKKTLKILDSFFNYLVEMRYLQGNPLAISRRRKREDHA